MTDPTLESAKEPVKQESPTPVFTETSPAKPPSTPDISSLAAEVAKQLRPDFEKIAQSTKDRRFSEIEKRLGISELEELGATIPDNVKLEYRLRELEAQKARVQEPIQGRVEQQNNEQVAAVIKELNLDANSPETISLLRGTYRNLDHFQAEAAKLRLKQLNQKPSDLSAAPAMQVNSAQQDKSVDAKTDDYIKDMKAARGDKLKLKAIQEKYKKEGVDIYSVDFTA